MKKAFIFLVVFITITTISSTCRRESEDCHLAISVQNKSTKTIYVTSSGNYPDTTYFSYSPNPILSPNIYKVLTGETNKTALQGRDCIEKDWDYFYKPNGNKIMVYIFDSEILETTPWDTVCKNYMVLKRYDLSLQDLKNMNWTITYP